MIYKEMKDYYDNLDLKNDENYQRIHQLISDDMKDFYNGSSNLSSVSAKSLLHTSIAEHFEPVIFLNSPFFYEMGIKSAYSWGTRSEPVDVFKQKQRDKAFSCEKTAQAYSDLDILCAKIGESWRTHLGLYRTPTPGFDSDHHSLGYTLLFNIGISGLLKKIEESKIRFSVDSDEYTFCDACEKSCNALIKIANKFSKAAEEAIEKCENSTQIKYMKMIVNAAKRVPENPPESFYEGLAMIWFLRETIGSLEAVGISVLGQVDLLLGKLYENDIKNNKITKDEAKELIRIWLMPTDIKFKSIESGWPETSTCIALGGCDSNGTPVFNEVTKLIIDVHCEMNLVAPKLNVRYSQNSPDEYLELISKKIIKGHNNFALSCDDVVIPSLEKCGFETSDARRYVNGGCQETMVEGAGHTAGAYMYVLLPAILDMSLNTSKISESIKNTALPDIITDASSFDEFYSKFLSNAKRLIQKASETQVIMGLEQKNINPCPLFSSTHEGCIENGKDYTAGGAKYNFSTICLCGIATLIDSLYAIKTIVYDRHELTLKQFSDILLNNWENAEELHQKCIQLPKYGHGNKNVDMLANQFIGDLNSCITEIPNERGGKNIMSMFTYYLYKTFAGYVRATADGRKDGEYLSQGIAESRLQKSNNLTEIFETLKNVDYTRISGISVLDIILSPGIDEKKLASFIKAAGLSGCPNLQLNHLSVEELKAARKNPEEYKHLIVRVSGLSVYFVNLDESIQDEIISRNIY